MGAVDLELFPFTICENSIFLNCWQDLCFHFAVGMNFTIVIYGNYQM